MLCDSVEVGKHRRLVESTFVKNNLQREADLAWHDPLYEIHGFVCTIRKLVVSEETTLHCDSWREVLRKIRHNFVSRGTKLLVCCDNLRTWEPVNRCVLWVLLNESASSEGKVSSYQRTLCPIQQACGQTVVLRDG